MLIDKHSLKPFVNDITFLNHFIITVIFTALSFPFLLTILQLWRQNFRHNAEIIYSNYMESCSPDLFLAFLWLENALTWQKWLSRGRPSEKMKRLSDGRSVLHVHVQRAVAFTWKCAHFKPDDIIPAANYESYAWGILMHLTVLSSTADQAWCILVCFDLC